ncbi:MAG: alkaline phosphatase D family protein [Bdellovibrionota bacterium]|nr:MAG: alkaline phosphatase family protein [Pseudomonadota bacterium]
MRINRRQLCASSLYAYTGLAVTSVLPGLGCGEVVKAAEPELLSTLGFGSCNKQNMLTTHWPIINEKKSQGWLWMGDAIYADGLSPRPRAVEYGKVLTDKGYQALLRQSFVMGTWDDHDYASNDGGIEYEEKIGSQESFLNFIDEPLDSLRRLQQGVYWSKTIGAPGNQIQFLLLDLRYFKQKDSVTSADPIGAAQWAWLESEISKPGPALKVVVSSIQVLTDFTGKDTWACYPEAQTRLLNLITKSPVPVSILSGDRHLHEISKRDLSSEKTIYEITSSGLTHFEDSKNSNPYRLDDQINETNFGVLTFDWDLTGAALLKTMRSSTFSPQTGALLRDFAIPLKW